MQSPPTLLWGMCVPPPAPPEPVACRVGELGCAGSMQRPYLPTKSSLQKLPLTARSTNIATYLCILLLPLISQTAYQAAEDTELKIRKCFAFVQTWMTAASTTSDDLIDAVWRRVLSSGWSGLNLSAEGPAHHPQISDTFRNWEP